MYKMYNGLLVTSSTMRRMDKSIGVLLLHSGGFQKRAIYVNSQRKEVATGDKLVSSQFASGPVQTKEDVDLFRYGSIAKALKFTGIGDGGDSWSQTGDHLPADCSDGEIW